MKSAKPASPKYLPQRPKAQAMVEFAIALPFLLLLLYGIIELARIAFIFSSASNASRAAARYGSGAGENSEGVPHYLDCDGIRDVANQSAYITDFSGINITYDRGVNSDGVQIPISGVDPNPGTDSCPIDGINVRNGDRIIVQISVEYEPIISIIPIDPLKVISSNARTFIVSIPILGSSVPTGFSFETSTPSRIPGNPTSTPTFTAFFTPTRVPINLTQYAYDLTNAPTATLTFTPSLTPLPSRTPTITPTRISCGGITGISNGQLQYRDNYIQMEIRNNTGYPINVSEVYIAWNHDKGHQGDNQSLHLRTIALNNQIWDGDILAPSQYIRGYQPVIPIDTSIIYFGFDQNYDNLNGTERVVISLLTPGCEGYLIDSDK
jgi:hypothetical protein